MNSLLFKGVRRSGEKVQWTFSPPNGCMVFLAPRRVIWGGDGEHPIPLPPSPLKGEEKILYSQRIFKKGEE